MRLADFIQQQVPLSETTFRKDDLDFCLLGSERSFRLPNMERISTRADLGFPGPSHQFSRDRIWPKEGGLRWMAMAGKWRSL
jgi:hypothetical protein